MRTHGSSALKPDGRYTVADYKSWNDDVRRELIDGVIYDMSPAPRIGHQGLVGAVFTQISSFLGNKPCVPFVAPVDVYLFPDDDDDDSTDVVQPDVLVVCDTTKIHDNGIHGVPDLVVEVMSPSTTHKDLGEKRDLYERAAVREYWLLNPDTGTALVWRLEGEKFAPVLEFKEGADVPSSSINGFVWKAARARKYG